MIKLFLYYLSFAVVWLNLSSGFQSLTQLTCSYESENQTRYLSCDLGNPMKSGTNVRTLFFWQFFGSLSVEFKG